ncbi:MAG: nickel-dependent hydrogenase large subunit [bacterium]
MSQSIVIDPLTRIEGHLKIKIEVESGRVARAFSSGEMFRGFEQFLVGRDPLDAQQITQRICGVCPVSHGVASILAQDNAYGVALPRNGRLLRNLIQGANYIQSHILHFYHLAALDFIDITAILQYQGRDRALLDLKAWAKSGGNLLYPAAPFLPRYSGDYLKDTEFNIGAIHHYLEALEMRRLAHEVVALFGGKVPHVASLVPGGVTERVTIDKMAACSWKLKKLREFIDYTYLPDVAAVARAFPAYFQVGRGCGNLLAYGVFPESDQNGGSLLFPAGVVLAGKLEPFDQSKITEDVKYSYFGSASSGLHPARGETEVYFPKAQAYSWLKAPRYQGQVMEVGPLARIMAAYLTGKNSQVVSLTNTLLADLARKPDDLFSVLGRHAARAIECKVVADRCSAWLEELQPDRPAFQDYDLPKEASGAGLTEAPRGALGHWLEIEDYKIKRYQCVVPTTWNCSPRDGNGNPGALEHALQGTSIKDQENPIEAARIVRSFDPCLACAVH